MIVLRHGERGCAGFSMDAFFWVLAAVVLVGGIAAAVIWRPIRAARRERTLARAPREIHRQSEQLAARFLTRASACGKPRAPRLSDSHLDGAVTYARDL